MDPVSVYWTCPICHHEVLETYYDFDAENAVALHEYVEHNVGSDPRPCEGYKLTTEPCFRSH